MAHYEKALSHFPDHPPATVGLSEILLDIYCQKIPPEPVDSASLLPSEFPPKSGDNSRTTAAADDTSVPATNNHAGQANGTIESPTTTTTPRGKPATPEELNRLAARDRAYGLLSALTKLGSGWDYSEAWFALSRAYEEGGQIEKAKEMLWWTVELEDTRPIRPWEVIGPGGGVL
jgi:cargo-transport protein YPP1